MDQFCIIQFDREMFIFPNTHTSSSEKRSENVKIELINIQIDLVFFHLKLSSWKFEYDFVQSFFFLLALWNWIKWNLWPDDDRIKSVQFPFVLYNTIQWTLFFLTTNRFFLLKFSLSSIHMSGCNRCRPWRTKWLRFVNSRVHTLWYIFVVVLLLSSNNQTKQTSLIDNHVNRE